LNLFAAVSVGLVIYCVVTTTWPGFAVPALLAALFALVVQHMEGRFLFTVGREIRISGSLARFFRGDERDDEDGTAATK
jgi:hypothetical protein